jgi:uncharacterized protein
MHWPESPPPQKNPLENSPVRWIAVFTDTPEMLAVRKAHEPLHLAYLRANASEILIGGGCRDGPGEPFVGGLWVLEVASRERAVELIEHDPYFEAAYRSYRLLTWGKALAEVVVTL